MAIHSGNLLVFGNIELLKNIQAPPPPPAYYRNFYNIIPTTSDIFNCVWADKYSSQTKGKVYFSTPGGVYVIDLSGKFLYQKITSFENNVTGEVLVRTDLVDLNVVN